MCGPAIELSMLGFTNNTIISASRQNKVLLILKERHIMDSFSFSLVECHGLS